MPARSTEVLDEWQLVRTAPDRYARPDDLPADWPDAVTMTTPTTVGAVAAGEDVDDFDWWATASVALTEATSITFRGLTFPADVYLDGVRVAECESMFVPVRIDVDTGRHDVHVHFRSLNGWLRTRRPRGRWRSSLVAAPGLRWARTTLIGRAPIYGKVLAPVGFWRPIVATPSRLRADVTVTADPSSGTVTVGGHTGAPDGTMIRVGLHGPDGDLLADVESRSADGRFVVAGRIDDHRTWWPRGYGAQPLYRVTIHLDGELAAQRAFGFRSVTAETQSGGFQLSLNGVPVFCRGATWSPPDVVRLTVDGATMRSHVRAFADAGANMVRVVGGLAYEQDEFWECCAELGIMVWQDAMQATFDPPAEISELIAREMALVLDQSSGNPALVVVSGGSETLQQPEMLGLAAADTSMAVIESLLPETVSRHSDAVYVRASPASPSDGGDLAIRPDTGVAHWFGVGGYLRPIADVYSARVKFAAECLAFANPAPPEAVARHFGSSAVAGHDPAWKTGVPRDRGASWDFEDVRDHYATEVFGEDLLAVRRVDPDRYLQLGRLAIAEAMRECFGFWRRDDSGCAGALVLAGKDLSPGAGWGLLDVDGAPKLALDVLARIWAPVAVILCNDGLSGVRLDVHNDTAAALTGQLTLVAANSTGARSVDVTRGITVPARSSLTFTDAGLSGVFRDVSHAFRFGPATADAIEATVRFDDVESVARDVLVIAPRTGQVRPGLRASASRVDDDRWAVRVTSDVALRYLTFDADGWMPSDNAFHLVAGVPHTVELTRTAGTGKLVGTVASIDALTPVPLEITP